MCRNQAVICKYWKVAEFKSKFISRGQLGEWRRLEAATSFISIGALKTSDAPPVSFAVVGLRWQCHRRGGCSARRAGGILARKRGSRCNERL